jgi:hypothetical protein
LHVKHKTGQFGGAGRSRTDLLGFAIRYITALLLRQKLHLIRLYFSIHSNIDRIVNLYKKGKPKLPFLKNWSGKRVSNSRPQPWQGCALPTELFPHIDRRIIAYFFRLFKIFKLMFNRFCRCRWRCRQACTSSYNINNWIRLNQRCWHAF